MLRSRSPLWLALLLSLFAAAPSATAQADLALGLNASVGYFDVNLVDGFGPAVGVTLGLGRLYGAARFDVGFADVPRSNAYGYNAAELECTERETGEQVAEVLCTGLDGFNFGFGAFSLEAAYALALPLFVAVGVGVRSGEEIDRTEGKTVATRPYATALVRHPFGDRLAGFAQAHLGSGYLQARVGLALSLNR